MKPLKTDQILIKNLTETIQGLQEENQTIKKRLYLTEQRYATLLTAFLKVTGAKQDEIELAKYIENWISDKPAF